MRQPELWHIRCFVCVAKHLHFSRAAEELGITPPSLTRQVQEAERLLGARLFHRTSRSVTLTSAGKAYLVDALAALEHLARAAEHASFAGRNELGRIAVGYVASAAYAGVLQQTIREFHLGHPRVEVELSEVAMDRVGSMLGDEQIDVAYICPPVRDLGDGIKAITVYRDSFILALPADSALAAFDAVIPTQLRSERFVVPDQESGTLEVARRGRFTPLLGPRPPTLVAVLAQVALGGNVAVVPRTLATCVTLPGIAYRPIAGKAIPSEVAAAFRQHERAPAVKAFLQQVRQNRA